MAAARRRGLVGLLALALVFSSQAGLAGGAVAASAASAAETPGSTAASTAAPAAAAAASVAAFTAAPLPVITGTARVGSPLAVVTGAWTPQPDSFTLAWKRNGVAIAGATGSAYTLVAADLGRRITVAATAVKAGYASLAKTSAATATVLAAPAPTAFAVAPKPTIVGTPTVGAPLTAAPGAWSPAPTAFAYRWLVNGVAVAGETGTTFTPRAVDARKRITVTVTATRDGSATTARTSVASAVVLAAPVVKPATFTRIPAPTVSGTAQVGATLTASPGAWAPAPSAFAYRWWANGVAIAGETSAAYTVRAADLRKRITVTVTGSLAGYTTAAKTSVATAAVVAAPVAPVAKPFAVAPVPVIAGTPVVGGALTATPGAWSPAATFAYRWDAGTTSIPGATGPTYAPVAGDVGQALRVTVTATAAGYVTTSRTSAATAVVVAADVPPEEVPAARVTGGVRLDVPDPGAPALTGSVELVDPDHRAVVATSDLVDGAFAFPGVDPGEYTLRALVEVDGETVEQYLGPTRDRLRARTFVVQAGGALEIEMVLIRPTTVSGTVTASDGSPVAGARVSLVAATDADFPGGSATTDAAGRYTVRDVDPGGYRVRVAAPSPNPAGLLGEWYGGSADEASGAVVTVRATDRRVVGVDAVLDQGARLTGVVRDAAGKGIADATVHLVPTADAVEGVEPVTGREATTDASGAFEITGILPGDHQAFVAIDRESAPLYVSRWAGGTGTRATATVFRAVAGAALPSPVIVLAVSPSVTARVTGLAAAGWDADLALVTLSQGGVVRHAAYARDGGAAFLEDVAPGT
ncbi:Cna protein B-type domain protein [Clavibacter michiganensis]|uniref:Cna protein B-type domain protein n=1 Tax=Clavibacter michiganensis TaxID=28447 RepID=A0A251YRG3_9MICO|nr:carboxypeptidase regulatory-like domain-containing protein [Clavibacter michiganensis]OUE26834.1 Cna protein B-type domain protein [Clavibacter michiganensis]